MGTIFRHNTGKALNASNHQGSKMQYITTSNLYWNRFELDKLKEMPFTDSEVEKCTVVKGDLLVCEGGDIGRAAVWNYDYAMRIQNHIHRLRSYVQVNVYYFYYLFFFYKGAGLIGGKGIGIQGLSSNALDKLLLPIPPLSEQHRIVAKIEELLPYIEKYEQAETELAKLNNDFPELLKKSILQEAVQGKLVPQGPNDEPASVLLERIRKEKQALIKAGKIKKDKYESAIITRDKIPYEIVDGKERCIADEVPFEIPEEWRWARCYSIGFLIRGNGIKRDETVKNGFPCIRYGEIYTTYNISFSETKSYIPKELTEKCKQFNYGDVIFTLTGENKPDIAKTVAYLGKQPVAAGGDLAIWAYHGMNPLYLVYFLNSPYAIKRKVQLATGDIIVHISCDKIGSILLPIPPLKEQERIVAKIEELTKFCEML